MQSIIDVVRGNIEIFLIACLVVIFVLSRLRRLVEPIFALIALAMFVAFMGFIVVRLGEIDLTIVAVIVVAMVVVDFYSSIRQSMSDGGENDNA